MKEDSITLPVPQSAVTTTKKELIRKYAPCHRLARRVPYSNNCNKRATQESVTSNALDNPVIPGDVLEMPPKTEAGIETPPVQAVTKSSTEPDNEVVKNVSKTIPKVETMSEAAILRSVLRPQGVPVPPDKVGLVREPQVIVRKFNIPIVCTSNNSKFTKLKERWKYQHDVVGMANVNPSNPLHAMLKTKPVVAYSVASFVNESSTAKPTSKISNAGVFPKTLVNPNRVPSSPSSSNVNGLAPSLPSTPTAVVKPVQVLPSLPSANSEGEKYVILKTMDDGENSSINSSDRDCEIIETETTPTKQTSAQSSAVTSPTWLNKHRAIIVQGAHISSVKKEHESLINGVRYLSPFTEVKDASNGEKVQMADTKEVIDLGSPSPEEMESEANTIHLEILSGGNLSGSGDVEMTVPSVPHSQDENVFRITAPQMSDVTANNVQPRKILPHPDNLKPFFITVPASVNGTISQLFLKPQPAPITVQTATPAPRLVAANVGEQTVLSSDGTVIPNPRTIQLTPVALTNPIKTIKTEKSDVLQSMLLKNTEQSTKGEVVVLKSLQQQALSLAPGILPAPIIVAGKNEAVKIKNDVVVLKSVQLQNSGTSGSGSDNLSLLTTRQSIAMQYQRDMKKAQEEVHEPRAISYPAHNIEVVDCSTQTSLFSLLEPGRLVEMTINANAKGTKAGASVVMPSSTVHLTTPIGSSKPTTTLNTASAGKRVVSVDSGGRVRMVGGSSPSAMEPLCKKLKLDQTDLNHGNIIRLLCSNKANQGSSDSPASQNINMQTVKNINDIVFQQHNKAVDINSLQSRGLSNHSKVQLNGVEAMVVDPSDVLDSGPVKKNSNNNNKPKVPQVDRKLVIKSAFNDWTNCLVPDEDGNVPLHNAVLDEDLNKVKRQCYVLAARKESVDIRNAEKQTPLHLAVWSGCSEIASTLLKFKARPELVDYKGNNALHLAVDTTSSYACLDVLLHEYNCKPFLNTLNYDGFSPLHLCAMAGKCDEAVELIKKGANINLRDGKSGRTALFHAVEARNSDLSRSLVQYGASASVSNYAGQTPLLATNDMSMLGERAMASVIMSRNSLPCSKERSSSSPVVSWKSEQEDR